MKALRIILLILAILCALSAILLFLLYRLSILEVDAHEASVGIIGGADGPTAIWVTNAFSPLSLTPFLALGGGIFFAAWLVLFIVNKLRQNKTSI